MVNANQPRDHFPPRAPYWPPDRFAMEQLPDDGRFTESQDVRRPPMGIDKALRECCHLPGKFYFVVVIGHDGRPRILSTPPLPPHTNVESFLDLDRLTREAHRAQSATSTSFEEPELGLDSDMNRYPLESGRRWTQDRRYGQALAVDNFEDDGNYPTRKRQRGGVVRRTADTFDDQPPVSSSSSKRGITVSDEKELWAFYEQRFKNIQQSACKLIAKAWVKAVEPKKQSTHPYTGSDEKAPDWWPKPWGPTKDERVRHKEPDHLYKRERVYLLNHILRMIVEPTHKQHQSIQKLNLNVSQLEEITNEALSSFFTDKDNPSNMMKKPYLKEIFRVARVEERYKDGQIDPTTTVFVMSDDRLSQGYMSDTEELGPIRDDNTDQNPTPISSSASPQRANQQQSLIPQTQSTDQSPSHLPGDNFAGEMPVRGTQYSHQVLGSEIGAERPGYVEGPNIASQPSLHPSNNMGLHDIYPPQHESSRRSSMYTSPSDFASPATPSLYPQWQSSAAPSSSSLYTFPPQTASAHPPFVGQPGVPMAQNQQYMGGAFDGLARGSHDAHPGNVFRPGGVSQSPIPHQSGYTNYMPQEAGSISASSEKVESLARHPTH
ncbi:hypothetical protein F5X99DRAFT_207262 [Biscogniauxia marginata]|nr:hypothetical protein F5X99DRAFT_207262 [Biscogniauxia marginata]